MDLISSEPTVVASSASTNNSTSSALPTALGKHVVSGTDKKSKKTTLLQIQSDTITQKKLMGDFERYY